MEGNIVINAGEIADLVKLTKEISDRVESMELMGNKIFMKSLRKSKEQIKNRDFADWNAI
jgi:hypothetical protein